jgi:hypothetical protein
MTLDTAARGWVFANGIANGRNPANNTFTGWGADTSDVNSWFGFDLSSLSGTVVAAELLLDIDAYMSPDSSETLVLRHVATPPGVIGTIDSGAHFTDLMTGEVFGSRAFTAGDSGFLRSIPLNASAVADLDMSIGGIWELGGHLSTVSRSGPYEAIFWGAIGDPSTTRLRITTVPEPAGVALMAIGLFALISRRRAPAGVLRSETKRRNVLQV